MELLGIIFISNTMNIIDKTNGEVGAYTYLLKFIVDNELCYYYGVRYANVKLNIAPINDLFVNYFTSSKSVRNLLNCNVVPIELIIHKVFNSHIEACNFECKFLTKINASHRIDFLNHVNSFNNSKTSNAGRKRSLEDRKRISKSSSERQSSDLYRLNSSKRMKSKWQDINFKDDMKNRNNTFWSSDKGKSIKDANRARNKANIGSNHSKESKEKMSIAAKEIFKKDPNEMSRRAKKRKKYICPCCNAIIGASNYNRHLKSRHNWTQDQLDASADLKQIADCG